MSRYIRMRRGRVTQVQGIASRGKDFFLMGVRACKQSYMSPPVSQRKQRLRSASLTWKVVLTGCFTDVVIYHISLRHACDCMMRYISAYPEYSRGACRF